MQHLEKRQQIDTSVLTHKDILINSLKNQLKMAEEKEVDFAEKTDKQFEQITGLHNDNVILKDAIELRSIELKNKTRSIELLEKRLIEKQEKV